MANKEIIYSLVFSVIVVLIFGCVTTSIGRADEVPKIRVPAIRDISFHDLHNLRQKEVEETQIVRTKDRGAFGVMLFPEHAQGDYIGVIHVGALTAPVHGDWKIADRFWQAFPWSSDVTAFAWGKDSDYLLVSTSGVYGESGLYLLDLMRRKHEKVFPVTTQQLSRMRNANAVTITSTSPLVIQLEFSNQKAARKIEIFQE